MTSMSKMALSIPAALMLSVAAPAMANAAQQAQGAAQASVSDAEIESFANAALALEEASAEWAPQIQAAEDDAERQELQADMQAEMVTTLEDNDMTVQRYNQIAQQAQSDQQLAARINAQFQSMMGEG